MKMCSSDYQTNFYLWITIIIREILFWVKNTWPGCRSMRNRKRVKTIAMQMTLERLKGVDWPVSNFSGSLGSFQPHTARTAKSQKPIIGKSQRVLQMIPNTPRQFWCVWTPATPASEMNTCYNIWNNRGQNHSL